MTSDDRYNKQLRKNQKVIEQILVFNNSYRQYYRKVENMQKN